MTESTRTADHTTDFVYHVALILGVIGLYEGVTTLAIALGWS